MTDKELLEKTAQRFRVIADDTQRITSGNMSHNLTCLRGFALRAAESIERHLQEPVSEDLEKEVYEHLWKGRMGTGVSKPIYFSYDELLEVARHFAAWQKEQLLAKVVDGVAMPDDGEVWCDLKSFNFKDGDKVKVIVIKED